MLCVCIKSENSSASTAYLLTYCTNLIRFYGLLRLVEKIHATFFLPLNYQHYQQIIAFTQV